MSAVARVLRAMRNPHLLGLCPECREPVHLHDDYVEVAIGFAHSRCVR